MPAWYDPVLRGHPHEGSIFMITLADIMERVSSTVDQRATPPTAGTGEYNWRKVLVNRVMEEIAQAYDFEWMRLSSFVTVLSAGSISLPENYKKMAGFPVLYGYQAQGEEWPEIKPEERNKEDSSTHFFYVLGNRGQGYTMVWNPGTLASGASLFIDFYTYPSLVTQATDPITCPNIDYITNRTIAYIFEAKNDPRTTLYLSRSRESLLQTIEEDNSKARTQENNVNPRRETLLDFRFGRD